MAMKMGKSKKNTTIIGQITATIWPFKLRRAEVQIVDVQEDIRARLVREVNEARLNYQMRVDEYETVHNYLIINTDINEQIWELSYKSMEIAKSLYDRALRNAGICNVNSYWSDNLDMFQLPSQHDFENGKREVV